MYPSLPLGPLSLPTAQILAIVAAWFGLSVMARVGRRLQLDPDMIWNLGTIAFAAGVIVARLSHAVQFWSVYGAEPLLLVSIRPGGLLLWPGLVGSLVAAYLYLIRVGVDPRPVGVAAVFGLLAGGVVLEISNFLTGAVVGTMGAPAGALSWFLSLTGDSSDAVLSQSASMRHPVALYRAIGMMLIVGSSLVWGNWRRPGRLGRPGNPGVCTAAAVCGRVCGGQPAVGVGAYFSGGGADCGSRAGVCAGADSGQGGPLADGRNQWGRPQSCRRVSITVERTAGSASDARS